jgi:ABC-2 type transport system permease protein
MLGALLYLRLTSLKNLLLSRLRRLKQPKYLLGAVVGVSYFYFLVYRRFLGGSGTVSRLQASLPVTLVPEFNLAGTLSIFGALVLLVIVLFTWALPKEKPGLAFSEAEIAFLFPAPISRRKLIHFRLLGAQLRILFSAMIFTVISRGWSFLGGGALTHVLGWWLILTTLNLHFTGAALTINRLIENGAHPKIRRWLILGAVTLIVSMSAVSIWNKAPPFPEGDIGPTDFFGWLARSVDGGLLHWLLIPGKLIIAPFLAANYPDFLRTAGPAALILIAHYFWVSRQETSFEEASIANAEKRAARIARVQRGSTRIGADQAKARREPFRLSIPGRPELAFLWKNLLGTHSYFHARAWVVCATLILIGVPWILRYDHTTAFATTISSIAALCATYTLLLGPQIARQDIRRDLTNIDILKTYPLAGWQIILGEILTPVAILTGLLWLALLAGILALAPSATTLPWLTSGFRLTAGLCIAATAPILCTLQLLTPNAAALLFPAWFQATRQRGGGIDVIGQRLIFVFGQFFIILLCLLPAVLSAAVVIFASQWLIGASAAVILGTLVALTLLGAEIACGLWWLGERFEKLDLATELRP